MFEIREIKASNKGFGIFSTRYINAGEVIVSEPPLLLYPQASLVGEICSHCLKDLVSNGEAVTCETCSNAMFCNDTCRRASLADSGSHSMPVCRMMSCACTSGASDETVSALHLLSRYYGLLFDAAQGGKNSRSRLEALQSLSEGNVEEILKDDVYVAWLKDVYQRFLPVFESFGEEFSVLESFDASSEDFVRSISLRDLVNAYGIRAPPRMGSDCSLIRGSALYKDVSRINHECLPNLVRCDDFDSGSTSMIFKALHDLPAGEEFTQSYFPLGWDFENRQARCSTVYGFTCSCPRCVFESGAEISIRNHQGSADEGYISIFLLKYLCIDEDCEGTMVPILGSAEGTLICNVCSKTRNEKQFLEMLES